MGELRILFIVNFFSNNRINRLLKSWKLNDRRSVIQFKKNYQNSQSRFYVNTLLSADVLKKYLVKREFSPDCYFLQHI